MSGSPPTRAKLIKTIAGLHTSGALTRPTRPVLALERRTVPRLYQWNPQQKFQLKRASWRRRPPVDRDRRTNKKPDKSPKVQWKKNVDEQECADLAAADEKVETYWCEEGGGPPKGEVCKPTPAPVKAYSYNFETMQPTNSPTPQSES